MQRRKKHIHFLPLAKHFVYSTKIGNERETLNEYYIVLYSVVVASKINFSLNFYLIETKPLHCIFRIIIINEGRAESSAERIYNPHMHCTRTVSVYSTLGYIYRQTNVIWRNFVDDFASQVHPTIVITFTCQNGSSQKETLNIEDGSVRMANMCTQWTERNGIKNKFLHLCKKNAVLLLYIIVE